MKTLLLQYENETDSLQVAYRYARDDLIRQIQSGELSVGQYLPSQRLLAERYKLSRTTLGLLLADLQVLGFIEVHPRCRPKVRGPKQGLVGASESPLQTLVAGSPELGRDLHSFVAIMCQAEICSKNDAFRQALSVLDALSGSKKTK